MLVLVTGASGFIGSKLCAELAASGHRVRAFHRASSPMLGLQGLDVEHVLGDITQPETLAPAMKGVEAVFHAAAQLGAPRDPEVMYRVTVDGTRHVLQAAGEAGIKRVIHTSSAAALGVPDQDGQEAPGADRLVMDERHTWNFRPEWWRYGHAKHLAEEEVRKAAAAGLDAVIVNPAVVVGAGDLNRVAGDLLLRLYRGRLPVSMQGGLNVIHIDDVVRGHVAALHYGRCGERYILGNENMPHQRFLEIAAQAAGARPPRLVLPGRFVRWLSGPVTRIERWAPLPVAGEALHKAGYYFYYDNTKARNELGLAALLPISQALEEAYAWYRKMGYL